MPDYKAGEPYTLSEYQWLYMNQHRYTTQQISELTKRDVRSLRGHLDKFGFNYTGSLSPAEEAVIRDNADLGDALIFLFPSVPLPVLREVANAQ